MKKILSGIAAIGASLLSTNSHAINCTSLPVWANEAVYLSGTQVQLEGKAYQANWWSQYHSPLTNSGQGQEWTLLGGCDSGASSSKTSSVAVTSSSLSSVSGTQQCNWWGVATYAICKNLTSGWGWENNKDCVGAATCASLPAPYGIIGGSSSVATSKSSSSISKSSSSVVVSSKSSNSVLSSKSSTSTMSSKSSSSVSSNAVLWQSTVLTGAVFTDGIEGPAVDINGDLYVANFNHNGSIGKISNGSTAPLLFVDLPAGSISSGIRFDANNNMYATDYTKHNVYKINIATKQISVYAHNNTMNQPNDLTIMANGVMFASDPDWSKDSGQLWRIETNGVTTLLSTTMGTTNGIEVSPDNKILYVNESIQRIIWKFDIDASGNISNKRVFKQFTDGGLDGMRADPNGNLYVARYGTGTVIVLSPTGVLLHEIRLQGTNPTNVTLSKDYKKCYVTLQDKRWVEVFNIQ